jgi:Tol biopolymer transport system component
MMKKGVPIIVILILLIAGYLMFACLIASNQRVNRAVPTLLIKARRAMVLDIPVTYAVTLDGKTVEGLPRGIGDCPEWSKDGKWIAFSTLYSGNLYDSDIFLMRSSGGKSIQVTEAKSGVYAATWSPESKRIAYECCSEIYILDIECAVTQEDTTGCQFAPFLLAKGSLPDWSPTKDQIVYDARVNEYDVYNRTRKILIIDMVSGLVEDITPENEAFCFDPRWSPDGEEVVVACNGNIYIVSPDNGVENAFLSEEIGWGTDPRWTPDGESIVFRSDKDADLGQPLNFFGNFEGVLRATAIYMMNIDERKLTRITQRSDEDILWFTWMPDEP